LTKKRSFLQGKKLMFRDQNFLGADSALIVVVVVLTHLGGKFCFCFCFFFFLKKKKDRTCLSYKDIKIPGKRSMKEKPTRFHEPDKTGAKKYSHKTLNSQVHRFKTTNMRCLNIPGLGRRPRVLIVIIFIKCKSLNLY